MGKEHHKLYRALKVGSLVAMHILIFKFCGVNLSNSQLTEPNVSMLGFGYSTIHV